MGILNISLPSKILLGKLQKDIFQKQSIYRYLD